MLSVGQRKVGKFLILKI